MCCLSWTVGHAASYGQPCQSFLRVKHFSSIYDNILRSTNKTEWKRKDKTIDKHVREMFYLTWPLPVQNKCCYRKTGNISCSEKAIKENTVFLENFFPCCVRLLNFGERCTLWHFVTSYPQFINKKMKILK